MKSATTKPDRTAKARAAAPPKTVNDGRNALTEEQVLQREKAFAIYRDMGTARTLHRLATVLKRDHPEIAVSHVTLDRWSKRHGWVARVAAYEQGIAIGQAPQPVQVKIKVDDAFNQVDALMAAAQMALTKAMKANPVVTRPSDVKTLVDAAANAMKLVDQLQSQQAGKGMKGEIAAEISKTLDLIEVARRKDVEFIVRAAAKAAADASGQPIEPIFQAAALAAGLRIELSGEQQPEKIEVEQVSEDVAPTATTFADVLAQFR